LIITAKQNASYPISIPAINAIGGGIVGRGPGYWRFSGMGGPIYGRNLFAFHRFARGPRWYNALGGIAMDVAYITLPAAELSRIAPLWEQLNAQHLKNSQNFKEHYHAQTFESRSAKFRALGGGCVHIGAAQTPDGALAGYCICTCEGDAGELDSIYIEAQYRGKGVGRRLAEDGVAWLKAKGCRGIIVTVADGNEQAFGFYERLGFRVRKTVLWLK
jgi:Acetyltransferases